MMSALPANFYHRLKAWEGLFQEGMPVLMYHKLGSAPLGSRYRFMAVPPKLFETQLSELKASGYECISLEAGLHKKPAAKTFSITFDDGYRSIFHLGAPILHKLGMKAIVYLLPSMLGKHNEWDRGNRVALSPIMTKEEARQWLQEGHEIGAHTLTHPHLTQIPLVEARREIMESKLRLEDLFGVCVKHFAYPYGDYNPAVRDLVAEAGFLTAVTTHTGINMKLTDPFQMERLTARKPPFKIKSILRKFTRSR
jgi:peptidoglycan/xylan/chitin deacetylase (PgdA/CDA1 family)